MRNLRRYLSEFEELAKNKEFLPGDLYASEINELLKVAIEKSNGDYIEGINFKVICNAICASFAAGYMVGLEAAEDAGEGVKS